MFKDYKCKSPIQHSKYPLIEGVCEQPVIPSVVGYYSVMDKNKISSQRKMLNLERILINQRSWSQNDFYCTNLTEQNSRKVKTIQTAKWSMVALNLERKSLGMWSL